VYGSTLRLTYLANLFPPTGADPGDVPLLATPVIKPSLYSLKSLTLYLTPFNPQWELGDYDSQDASLHHHCHLISRFPKVLPSIEHLDLTVPCLCAEAWASTTRPRARDGRLILNVSPNPRSSCLAAGGSQPPSLGWVHQGAQVLNQMRGAQERFSEMKDWDVQICLEEFGFRPREARGE
jgi:hypothetical protein